MKKMIDRNDVTFVIPIFNLVDARLNNLKFILPYILSTGCKVLVVEQVSTNNSLLTDMLSSLVTGQYAKNFKHLLYLHDNKLIHKSGIINWATKNHVDTKYVWVNDADFYMKYNDVFHTPWNTAFIQPYQVAKKLNKENSDELFHGKKLNVDFSDEESMYISMYGALSFIFEKSAFLDMGGMNENLFGWGQEDVELSNRLKESGKQTQTLEFKGIHLWHQINPIYLAHEKKEKFYLNYYFDEVYCANLDRRGDRWENVKKQFDNHGIRVTRFSAVDGKDITYDQFYPYFCDKPFINGKHVYQVGDIENKGALGCLKTHLGIIKDAKLKGHKRILIFEDDVVLSKDFDNEIRKIENLDWKMLYLGVTQYDWSNLFIGDGLYLSKNSYGTFAYAVDSSIYDYLIDKIENSRQTIDRTYISAQKDLMGYCYTLYPNIVIPYVDESDIRDSIDINNYSTTMRWNLENFELEKHRKKKILLMPDARGWAFDNIVKAIVKYNPCPDKIHYEIMYARDLHQHKYTVDPTEWDLIYVMFEAERIIPQAKNVIRGCYAAYWLENKNYPPKILGKYFTRCKGAVFANQGLKDQLSPYLPSSFPTEIIHDAADETVFYPIEGKKNSEFTVIFVGNTKRKIKNFSNIVWVCQEAGVNLKVCEKTEHKDLVHEYATADLCINFSTFEGGPQTFVEAALCGVPMLIRNTNELSKIIPCFTGETTEDFVAIINHLKNNRHECVKKGKEAYDITINSLTYRHAADKFAKFFLKNVPKKNLENELTVFIIRSGKNPNYEDCVEAIKNQNCTFVLDEIVDVSPMSAAFQQMIERCDTPYYVQVDEDMILDEGTIERLYYSIKCTKRNICIVTHMLTDVHLNINIFGIKIYRHDIMINYPYNLDIISCEKDQMTRLENDGYIVQMIEKSLGKHSPKWSPELIYERYFDLMEKWKVYKYDWMGKLPKKLFDMVKINPSDENIYALLGIAMSVSTKDPIRKREKNFLVKEEAYENLKEMLSKKD
jgi:GR25 family glycosyltransferase involved in LPS biosynthesis